jgi:hypothetical protein
MASKDRELVEVTGSNGGSNDDEQDAEWVDLDPGETAGGTITDVNRDAGDYDSGVVEFVADDDTDAAEPGTLCVMWGNNTLWGAFDDYGTGVGDRFRLHKDDEPRELSDGDGEFYPLTVEVTA